MTTEDKIEKFRNVFESEIEEIALFLKQNKNPTNLFILKFNNSIYELLDSTFTLLHKKYIESSGSIISTLWERNLTIEYIFLDFENRTEIYNTHNKLKKSPWKIFKMVQEVCELNNHPKLNNNIKFNLYYIQYSFLCAIKHGNPYTFKYLNREEIQSEMGLNTFDEKSDSDLIIYLKIITLNIIFEYLTNFYHFINDEKKVNFINQVDFIFSELIKQLEINVPRIINPSKDEYDEEVWNYFDNL